jgi:hypothetical protein
MRCALLGSAAALAHKKPEDVYKEKFFAGLTANIPIASPVINMIESQYNQGMYGQEITIPQYEIVNSIGKTIAQGGHVALDEHATPSQHSKFYQDLSYSLADLTGIPSTAVAVGLTGANKMLGK